MTTPAQNIDSLAPLHRSLVATAWIAGVFCALLVTVMVWNHLTATTIDPWKSPQLLALKQQLVAEPKNEPLKQQIRELDFEFRQKFRRRLELDNSGGWLLLGGVLVLVFSARKAMALRIALTRWPSLPSPLKGERARVKGEAVRNRPPAENTARAARWSVAGIAVLFVTGLIAVSLSIGTALPNKPAELQKLAHADTGEEPAVVDQPTLAEMQANSPRFRGWDGGGTSTDTNVLLSWDNKSGPTIAWRSPVPLSGNNSPVVWGNRVFISGATADIRKVFCYDATNGRLLWERAIENVPGSPVKPPEVMDETGYACPTMATDGRRVYAIFANGDLAALTFDGAIAWSKSLWPLKNSYGHATSLAISQSKLIVQLDQQGTGSSKLLAFDGATGRVLWERGRPVAASWATPIVIQSAGREQIVTLGEPWVIGYSLADGMELWRASLLQGEVTPSPIFAGGLVMIVNPSSQLLAVRPDGAGDVTKTHVAWTIDDNVPDVGSPVSNGELVFAVNSGGVLTCFDAKYGKKIWNHELQMDVQSSPSIAGDRLLVLGGKGTAIVVEAGRQFKELAHAELADKFVASPAFANGRVFLRGVTNLFCIGPAAGAVAKAQ